MKDKTQVRRRIHTQNHLLGAAKAFAKQAHGEAEFDSAMACALFCALTLEAVLNHIGATLLPIWDVHLKRKLSPEGKLALIASQAHCATDFGQRPFQAFRALFELRNQLAHGTTQDLPYEKAKHWLIYGDRRWPAAQWETLCTAQHAASLLSDTEQMVETLYRASGVESIPRFLLSEHVAPAQQGAAPDPPAAVRPPGG